MHPAFSVIFLTTLIGVGQGLFLALFTGQSYAAAQFLPAQNGTGFFAMGSLIALLFLIGGLISSIFHLGHPERAWRAATKWRTSWLSREVLALPVVMFFVFVYGLMHYMNWDMVIFVTSTGVKFNLSLLVGAVGAAAVFILFLCTAMIYAAIKFLQEWSNPLTIVNYILLGTASGFTLAAAFSSYTAPDLIRFFSVWAIIITVMAFVSRSASLIRNARIKYKSSIQTAIGVRHNQIVQNAQGAMGGSYNTREYFHGKTAIFLKSIKWLFMMLVFPVPIILLSSGMDDNNGAVLLAAFMVQYVGLLAERWFFFAQANHPQNIYYQTV
ncbi:MAG: dimethyl sulfoxide reductase anchor subunit [Gammaproteobacteria bacterium]|nr:dimethyl sulfoxide reductase anchor subunit [Gammaproteobacteria bacterium]MCW8910905.1 dimethyl sulfoxide reductase anchor subunit [Gammaproteobacteria bacterium]MCW9004595.1 dimethyl sulfoxide reductase anchor subunit [Gammaproteobacteria bacterium]MCW9056719.1 dimethyl sulfoxide reductase anchor subunit [Gammaproteobacteria bacterium]